MIYLDNASTTPLSKTALDTLYEVSSKVFGNPSSVHQAGRSANHILRDARQAIALILEAEPHQIVFTSGGTESDNTAIIGYALAHQEQGKHIITTAIEHHAVLNACHYLEKYYNFEITYLQPQNGTISAQQILEALRPETILVSVMHANNETGHILPVKEIGEVLSEHTAVFHVDAVQTMGKLPIKPKQWGIDLLSASAHKFHGPKGVGFLYTRDINFLPLLHGGNQENKRRASTENLPSIAAMSAALTESNETLEKNLHHVTKLKTQLLSELESIDFSLNSPENGLPYVLNLNFPNQLNEQLLMKLDLAGISLSAGSACTAGNIEPSHVLQAFFGKQAEQLKSSIRISFSKFNTFEEIHEFIYQLKKIL